MGSIYKTCPIASNIRVERKGWQCVFIMLLLVFMILIFTLFTNCTCLFYITAAQLPSCIYGLKDLSQQIVKKNPKCEGISVEEWQLSYLVSKGFCSLSSPLGLCFYSSSTGTEVAYGAASTGQIDLGCTPSIIYTKPPCVAVN